MGALATAAFCMDRRARREAGPLLRAANRRSRSSVFPRDALRVRFGARWSPSTGEDDEHDSCFGRSCACCRASEVTPDCELASPPRRSGAGGQPFAADPTSRRARLGIGSRRRDLAREIEKGGRDQTSGATLGEASYRSRLHDVCVTYNCSKCSLLSLLNLSPKRPASAPFSWRGGGVRAVAPARRREFRSRSGGAAA